MQSIYAWNTIPTPNQLAAFLAQHSGRQLLLFRLPENRVIPHIPANAPHFTAWQNALRCVQFQATNFISDFIPQTDVMLLPYPLMAHLTDYSNAPIHWQTEAVLQQSKQPEKPWQTPPHQTTVSGNLNALIIGAGIAGAATAYELARRGVKVQVLEAQKQPAQAASGNYQGLLYAKISPHPTAQTELLLSGYGYTRYLLQTLLPEQTTWQSTGVLHLNHNTTETVRNQALAQQTWHQHLYHAVNSDEASQLAGIPIQESGLFWQQGAWLNPASLIARLLSHPNITLYTQCSLKKAQHDGNAWHIETTQQQIFSGSHLIFCTGANSTDSPIIHDFPTQMIRGQTSLARATEASKQLKIALSGASYLAPAWQEHHCFGATFINNDTNSDWRATDERENWLALTQLNAQLAHDLQIHTLLGSLKGHTAIRCDSHDHLPIVGALGDVTAMRQVYAKLAMDKNYRLSTPCPYLPNAYANIAHGSRGLATAPICAAQLASEICNETTIFSSPLRHALQPNRLIIRKIVQHKF